MRLRMRGYREGPSRGDRGAGNLPRLRFNDPIPWESMMAFEAAQ